MSSSFSDSPNAATYNALRRRTSPTRTSNSRSRLRTNTDPSPPELHPQPELCHKILVVGGRKCGKTSLARFYAEHSPKQHYSQTIGSDLYVVPYGVLCGRQVYLKLLDVGHAEVHGSPSFLSLTTADTAGVLLVFDVTNPNSFAELDEWASTLRTYIPSLGTRVPVIILAHKADCLQARTTVQHIRSIDLDRFVAANQFTDWRWSTTRTVPGASSKLLRSIPDAVHSLVEAVLVSAAEYYSTTRKSFSGAILQGGSGTLEQLLRTHQSATYVQIPQTARPGESKLEAGAALLPGKEATEMQVLERRFIVEEATTLRPSREGGEGGGEREGTGKGKGEEMESRRAGEMLYRGVQCQLEALRSRLVVSPSGKKVPGATRLCARIDALELKCENEKSEMVMADQDVVCERMQMWQMLLREVELLL